LSSSTSILETPRESAGNANAITNQASIKGLDRCSSLCIAVYIYIFTENRIKKAGTNARKTFSCYYKKEFEKRGGCVMSEGKRRFKATIDGETYTIVGSKPEKHMRVVAETVDEQLSQLKELTKGLDKEKRAILLAINAVSDQLATRNELEHLKEKYEQLEQNQKN